MRHAYYLAQLDQTFGDAEYGKQLRDIFHRIAGDFFTIDEKGKKIYYYSRFDGVSCYDTPTGVRLIIILKDFFNPNPKAYDIREVKEFLPFSPAELCSFLTSEQKEEMARLEEKLAP
jgi:hypothetical protein